MFKFVQRTVGAARFRLMVAAAFVASCLIAAVPASSMATGTPTEEKVGEIASSVGTEGVTIVLAILAALVSLLVAIIVIPKAVGLIKRFI